MKILVQKKAKKNNGVRKDNGKNLNRRIEEIEIEKLKKYKWEETYFVSTIWNPH